VVYVTQGNGGVAGPRFAPKGASARMAGSISEPAGEAMLSRSSSAADCVGTGSGSIISTDGRPMRVLELTRIGAEVVLTEEEGLVCVGWRGDTTKSACSASVSDLCKQIVPRITSGTTVSNKFCNDTKKYNRSSGSVIRSKPTCQWTRGIRVGKRQT